MKSRLVAVTAVVIASLATVGSAFAFDCIRVSTSLQGLEQSTKSGNWLLIDVSSAAAVQRTFETIAISRDTLGDEGLLMPENLEVQIQKFNGGPIGVQLPSIVEMTVTRAEPGVRGDTASGGVTKAATLETGLEIRVPLFIKEGERVKVHTETREFAGRA